MLRHRCPATFGLLVLLVLGRGASALAQANAEWNVTFQDPTHFDISDAGGVFAKAAVYRDAMEDVLRALMVFPRIATIQFEPLQVAGCPVTALEMMGTGYESTPVRVW